MFCVDDIFLGLVSSDVRARPGLQRSRRRCRIRLILYLRVMVVCGPSLAWILCAKRLYMLTPRFDGYRSQQGCKILLDQLIHMAIARLHHLPFE